MKQAKTTKQEEPKMLLPDEIDTDWPRLNDGTTCLCILNDGGEILVRIENDEEYNEWQAFFAEELVKRYNERKALLDSHRELKEALDYLLRNFDSNKNSANAIVMANTALNNAKNI